MDVSWDEKVCMRQIMKMLSFIDTSTVRSMMIVNLAFSGVNAK